LKFEPQKYRNQIAAFVLCLLLASPALATQISGTVTNGTTNKPSAGDEVVLLSLAGGMNEVARTKTDNQGRYSLTLPDNQTQHLIRVTRQSVSYFKSVLPGAATADVTVFDAATELSGVSTVARVFHFQASSSNLDVRDMHVLKNDSLPPRSKIGNQTFAVTLPDGAQLTEASITGPSGMPLAVTPVPSSAKNRYAFDFSIRPGETRFEVVYKLPYNGQYEFSFTPDAPLSELGVLLPKSIKFAGVSTSFRQDSDETGLAVFFTKNVPANQPVTFSLAGEGLVPQEGSAPQEGSPEASSPGSVPPASAATPANTSVTQSSAFWYIAGGIVGVMVGLALVIWRKNKRAKSAAGSPNSPKSNSSKSNSPKPAQPSQDQPPKTELGDMLEVLKDELFQLETDRLNGKISEEEYAKTKEGLDTLLRRQMNKR
jgi:hypothetical protein